VKLAVDEEPRQAEVVDLMERLRRSLDRLAQAARQGTNAQKAAKRRTGARPSHFRLQIADFRFSL
jgi:non-homologous end joining protein Ku